MPFRFVCVLILACLWGCQKPPVELVNPRLAVVRFDNQGSEEDRWVGEALGLALMGQFRERPELAVTVVEDEEGVRTLGAGRKLSGNYRRTAKGFEIRAVLTDAYSMRVLAQGVYRGSEAEIVALASRIGSELTGVRLEKLEGGEQEWRDLSRALVAKDEKALEQLVASHPEFLASYPHRIRQLLARNLRGDAVALAAKMPAGGYAVARAQVELQLADGDDKKLQAMEKLSALRSGDPLLAAELAQLASRLTRWDLAAKAYERLTVLERGKVEWWNSLGYAQANLGKLKEAVEALEQYRKLAPADPNAIDSLGEVNYMNRNFPEAARKFEEQVARFPAFQNLAGLRKAAFAYANAGDLKQADARFADWTKRVLAGLAPSGQALIRALWLARTGREQQAVEMLKKEAAESSGERRTLAEMHAAALRFGWRGERPAAADWKRWQTELAASAGRNELFAFALLAQDQPAELKRRQVVAATAQPQLAGLRQQMLAAVEALEGRDVDLEQGVFPLPPVEDSIVDALLFRKRPLVLR